MKKIMITGGHLSPAIAFIDQLILKNSKQKIVFVGRKNALSNDRSPSLEYQEITKRQIRFIDLKTGRFTRAFSKKSFINFFLIPYGLLMAFKIIFKEKPDLIFSFGGYLGLPVCIAGYMLKVPVYTHEQTIAPGLANRITGFMARKIFISFPESAKYFAEKKTIVSGNLLKPSIFQVNKKPFVISSGKPVIYITGGTLGSHSINNIIKKVIEELLDKYVVIHQTGSAEEYHDFETHNELKKKLCKEKQENYHIVKNFFDDEVGYIYSISDLVIGRSGANTFFELIALRKPAILIPLPWSANGEQQKHAQVLNKNGVAEIFYQNEPDSKFLALIEKLFADLDNYKKNYMKVNYLYKTNAFTTIIKELPIKS